MFRKHLDHVLETLLLERMWTAHLDRIRVLLPILNFKRRRQISKWIKLDALPVQVVNGGDLILLEVLVKQPTLPRAGHAVKLVGRVILVLERTSIIHYCAIRNL